MSWRKRDKIDLMTDQDKTGLHRYSRIKFIYRDRCSGFQSTATEQVEAGNERVQLQEMMDDFNKLFGKSHEIVGDIDLLEEVWK